MSCVCHGNQKRYPGREDQHPRGMQTADVIVSLNLGSDSEQLWSTPEISLVSQMPYMTHSLPSRCVANRQNIVLRPRNTRTEHYHVNTNIQYQPNLALILGPQGEPRGVPGLSFPLDAPTLQHGWLLGSRKTVRLMRPNSSTQAQVLYRDAGIV